MMSESEHIVVDIQERKKRPEGVRGGGVPECIQIDVPSSPIYKLAFKLINSYLYIFRFS